MTTTTVTTTVTPRPLLNPKPKLYFSFAAYSKHLISHLQHHSNLPIAPGLSQSEFSTIESTFGFTFPPDLRSILTEGLPIAQGFPNWRSSSYQQLHILINLPILGLCKDVSRRKFWYGLWGDRPEDDDEAVELAKRMLRRCPVLVPVYRNCYVAVEPCLAGNPVFYVNGSDVRVCSYDVVGLFQWIEVNEGVGSGMGMGRVLSAPLWAATDARRIEFWTELVEQKNWCCSTSSVKIQDPSRLKLRRCLEDVRLRLRVGGWKDEDLDEMMMVEYSSSSAASPPSSTGSWSSCSDDDGGGLTEEVVRVLSRRLLSGGWSMGDVVESLGCLSEDVEDWTVEIENCGGGDTLFDFEHNTYSCQSQV